MVFVDKTLDDMLKEIGFSKPIKIGEFEHWTYNPKKSYLIKTEPINTDVEDAGDIIGDIENHFCTFFQEIRYAINGAYNDPGELLTNSIEWGGGIKIINYYVAPEGVVVEIIQNKEWNYEKILELKKNGYHPSRRKKNKFTSKTDDGGGCGLSEIMGDTETEVNYEGKSTLVLYNRKTVEKNIREQRADLKKEHENLRN